MKQWESPELVELMVAETKNGVLPSTLEGEYPGPPGDPPYSFENPLIS